MQQNGEEEIPLTWDLYQMIPKYLTAFQTCFQCGVSFRECENIGLHLCHIHPGVCMLTNAGPSRSFYSCCGRLMGTQGCLEADHSVSPLELSDVRQRVKQLRDFATIILPCPLLRFITPPLQSSVLYRGTGGGGASSTPFRHTFSVLLQALETTRESSFTHSVLVPVYDKAVDNVGLFVASDNDEEVATRVYDLKNEARALVDQSKDSPLLLRLMALTTDKKHKARVDCENAWRSRIGRGGANGDEVNDSLMGKEQSSIPFVIIGRLHDVRKSNNKK